MKVEHRELHRFYFELAIKFNDLQELLRQDEATEIQLKFKPCSSINHLQVKVCNLFLSLLLCQMYKGRNICAVMTAEI